MKKNLLKMALLAFATFAASVASAQSTDVLHGNVGEVSTTEAPALEEVTYYGTAGGSDEANWIDKVAGYFPTIEYSATTTAYNQMVFKIKLSEIGAGFATPELWCDQLPAPEFVGMTKVEGTENEFTATLFDKNAKTRGDQINFRFRFPMTGGAPMTKNIYMKVGDSNTKPSEDTTAPVWNADPVAQKITDKTAEIVVNVTDDSGSAVITLTGDNGFAELKKAVKADGTNQTIELAGLTANTAYNLTLALADAAGNVSAEVKTVTFTTTEAPALEEVTYYGTAGGSEEANWIDKVAGYFPTIEYSATTTAYNQMVFKIKLSEIGAGFATPELWCDQLPAPEFVGMTKVEGTENEFTATLFDKNAKTRGDQINFRFRFPMTGGAPMTKNIYMKVGDSNTKPSEDTTAPVWNADPVAQKITDKTAEIVVNVTDDSGSAVITLTGDNGFAELKKAVKADGTDQTIELTGLTANTTYNLTLALADAAGNAAGDSKTVNFTTEQAPDLAVLYQAFDFTSADWRKNGESNTFAPNGRLLLTVNADNTVTVKVTVDEGVEAVEFAEFILHGIDSFRINAQEDGSFVGTSTNSISNREALQAFHMNFVLKNGVGNSELAVMYFTPSEGSTSAVAEVEAEAAKVVAANGVIRVEGDKTFAVYTVAGQLAFRGMGEVRLDKGVYVVVVDGKAQKVML